MVKNAKKKILLIEDDAFLAKMYQTKLTKSGYQVIVALDGKSGYQKIVRQRPDLILLDLVLPVMSGQEILMKICQQPELQKIPVLVLTNVSQPEAIRDVWRYQVKEYMIKSQLNPSDIIKIINNYL
ncbi:MAG: response regulator [Candidatus Komeilibacteria bacterium CG_4_10_14_0_2_um_filter_37_10]|uniref:Response regulator n=1 Tax=Candidatus Komeilibacteria bacterium CG_4_10_14_0_2_um_filter_37_10 TaxID=1974470 RepID=A0A2M7VEY0_9BACT|nr:MAG: response regulator [Candidatus Komeilibacteria bacterium CG_4_10_14_0_2_um_filter_37_10]PJA92733.1 MAG: response regulator [Candidatus Komeilibacteria bacterium CG_4_9_14_3_um_filter_37_5]